MARQSSTRAGDFTGKQKAELAAQHAAEQEAKASSIAMATAEARANRSDEVVDLVPRTETPANPEADGAVAVTDVDVEEPQVEFRVNETLEAVTLGHGNNYDFIQGQKYKAPKWIYDHLDAKGLVWH